MEYILDCDGKEIDGFKSYKKLDTETCRLETVSGHTVLRNKSRYRFGLCAYKGGTYEFKTHNIHIRVDNNVVFVEHTAMLYVMAGANIECIYREGSVLHVRWRLGKRMTSEVMESTVDLDSSRISAGYPLRVLCKAGTYIDLIKKSDVRKIIYGEDYKKVRKNMK